MVWKFIKSRPWEYFSEVFGTIVIYWIYWRIYSACDTMPIKTLSGDYMWFLSVVI